MTRRVHDLNRERLLRERKRRAALRRERERQKTIAQVTNHSLVFLRKVIGLGWHNLTLVFSLAGTRYSIEIKRLGTDPAATPQK